MSLGKAGGRGWGWARRVWAKQTSRESLLDRRQAGVVHCGGELWTGQDRIGQHTEGQDNSKGKAKQGISNLGLKHTYQHQVDLDGTRY